LAFDRFAVAALRERRDNKLIVQIEFFSTIT
jgi:hypothetical protein